MDFLKNPYVKAALTVGACIMVAKYVKNEPIKAAAYGIAGVVVVKQIPFAKDALA